MKKFVFCIVAVSVLGVAGPRLQSGEIHEAVERGDIAELKAILKQADTPINKQDPQGKLPLSYALQRKDSEMLELLLSHGADPNVQTKHGSYVFFNAVRHKAPKRYLRLLLEHGAKVDLKNEDGNAPLHRACQEGNTKIAELLVDHGADVNLTGRQGLTPLHIACRKGSLNMVKLLLSHDADPNRKTAYPTKRSPLHNCGMYETENTGRIIKHLLDAGGNLNVRDKHGRTPLHRAAAQGNFRAARKFVSEGADLNAKAAINGHTPLHCAVGSESGPDHKTPIKLIRFLLKEGGDVEISSKAGRTPLLFAARLDNKTKAVQVLLENNADMNATGTQRGRTALHLAAQFGRTETVEFLVNHGADPKKEDNLGLTPRELAKKHRAKALDRLSRIEDKKDLRRKRKDLKQAYTKVMNTLPSP